MKYIRTKDGRIGYLSSEPNEEITDYEIITSKGTITYRREDEIIKVADTIEKLCDEFVIQVNVHNIVLHDLNSALNYVKDYKNHELTKDYIIYGAIWTDKGLIYKAKLKGILPNGKLDWELL